MSRKRYADFDDFCVDTEGNELIVLQETASPPTPEVEVPVENVQYVYENDQAYTNSKGSLAYRLIDAETSNVEHNSSGPNNIKVASSSVQRSSKRRSISYSEWKADEIKLLLKKYEEYNQYVGSDKKFKNIKEMWVTISEEMNSTFNTVRTPNECMIKFSYNFEKPETNLKTQEVLFSFKDEIDTLDSLHEIIMKELAAAKKCELEIQGQEKTGADLIMNQILPKTLIELAKVKALAQERRHREYMDCVKSFEVRFMENITKIIDNI